MAKQSITITLTVPAASVKAPVGTRPYRVSATYEGTRYDGLGATQAAAVADLQNRLNTVIQKGLS